MNRFARLVMPALAAGVIGLGIGAAKAQDLKEVTLVQAHAQLGVGEEVFLYAVPNHLGYFAEEGLKVDIQGVRGSSLASQVLQSGDVEFASANPEVILSVNEKGGSLVVFAALRRVGGYAIAARADNDSINGIEDLAGKTIGVASLASGAVPIIKGMMSDLGHGETDFSLVAAGMGGQAASAIATDKVDALGLWDATYAVIENHGVKLKYFEIPIIEKLAGFSLATRRSLVEEDPDMVAGFCRAMAKGVVFAKANPRAAVEIFYKVFPQTKPTEMTDKAVADHVNILTTWMGRGTGSDESVPVGWNYPEKWSYSYKYYQETGRLKGPAPLAQNYTNELIERCNDFDKEAIRAQAKAM